MGLEEAVSAANKVGGPWKQKGLRTLQSHLLALQAPPQSWGAGRKGQVPGRTFWLNQRLVLSTQPLRGEQCVNPED